MSPGCRASNAEVILCQNTAMPATPTSLLPRLLQLLPNTSVSWQRLSVSAIHLGTRDGPRDCLSAGWRLALSLCSWCLSVGEILQGIARLQRALLHAALRPPSGFKNTSASNGHDETTCLLGAMAQIRCQSSHERAALTYEAATHHRPFPPVDELVIQSPSCASCLH